MSVELLLRQFARVSPRAPGARGAPVLAVLAREERLSAGIPLRKTHRPAEGGDAARPEARVQPSDVVGHVARDQAERHGLLHSIQHRRLNVAARCTDRSSNARQGVSTKVHEPPSTSGAVQTRTGSSPTRNLIRPVASSERTTNPPSPIRTSSSWKSLNPAIDCLTCRRSGLAFEDPAQGPEGERRAGERAGAAPSRARRPSAGERHAAAKRGRRGRAVPHGRGRAPLPKPIAPRG